MRLDSGVTTMTGYFITLYGVAGRYLRLVVRASEGSTLIGTSTDLGRIGDIFLALERDRAVTHVFRTWYRTTMR